MLAPATIPALPTSEGVYPPKSSALGQVLRRLSVGLGIGLGQGGGGSGPSQTRVPTPVASLFWVLKDGNGNDVDKGEAPVPATAATGWQRVALPVKLEQAGTLHLEVVGGSSPVPVLFDDVVVRHRGGLIVQEQHQYPYGAPLTGLNYVIGTRRYRHGYQGQYAEVDTTTGWSSFELRLYDATRARWSAPDPEGQYASPYVAMGNNPVTGVDPDGGLSLAGPGIRYASGRIGGGILQGVKSAGQAIGAVARAVPASAWSAASMAGMGRNAYQKSEASLTLGVQYGREIGGLGRIDINVASMELINVSQRTSFNGKVKNELIVFGMSISNDGISYPGVKLESKIGLELFGFGGEVGQSQKIRSGFGTSDGEKYWKVSSNRLSKAVTKSKVSSATTSYQETRTTWGALKKQTIGLDAGNSPKPNGASASWKNIIGLEVKSGIYKDIE